MVLTIVTPRSSLFSPKGSKTDIPSVPNLCPTWHCPCPQLSIVPFQDLPGSPGRPLGDAICLRQGLCMRNSDQKVIWGL